MAYNKLTPQQQDELARKVMGSFGNAKVGNVNRAKQQLQDFPEFAQRMMEKNGMAPETPSGSAKGDDGFRSFSNDDAVYRNLKNGPQEEATPSPAAKGSGGTKKMRPATSSTPGKRPESDDPFMEQHDDGRQRAMENANRESTGRAHMHTNQQPQSNIDRMIDQAMEGGVDPKVMIGVATAAAGAGGAAYLYNRVRNRQAQNAQPLEGEIVEPGRNVAVRQPRQGEVIDGEVVPPKQVGQQRLLDDQSQAEATMQRSMEPAQLPDDTGRWDSVRGSPVTTPESIPMRGPSRASQYPMPDDDLTSVDSVMRNPETMYTKPDTGGVARTTARRPTPKVRARGGKF